MGHEIHHNPYHIQILRSRLTQSIGALYQEIRNEITTAFDDILNLRGNGKHLSLPSLFAMMDSGVTQNGGVCRRSAVCNTSCAERPTGCSSDSRCVSSVVYASPVLDLGRSRSRPRLDRSQPPVHAPCRQGSAHRKAVPKLSKTVSCFHCLSELRTWIPTP